MLDIYGTLGPACWEVKTLEEMFRAGMTGVRLNLSHVTLPQAARQLENLHRAAANRGIKAKLLIDMQGPELRIEGMNSPLKLPEGRLVILGVGGIPVPDVVLPHLQPGQEVLLDDGKILLTVTERLETGATAKVLRGGLLQGRKSIALPGADIHPPTMTKNDRENIALAAECGVTGVMQPFVRNREDLRTLRKALDDAGGEHIKLFAKVENTAGMEKLPELIQAADEIVIARGDLGNAIPLWELPAAQKGIAAQCRAQGRAFMVVTQMLASMEHSPVPTRAEVSDIFNAVLDGASSVMVTGETAVGKYPVETIRYLKNTVDAAVEYMQKSES